MGIKNQIKSELKSKQSPKSNDIHRPKHVCCMRTHRPKRIDMHSNTMSSESNGLFDISSKTSAAQKAAFEIPKSKPAVIAICYALLFGSTYLQP